MSDGSHLNMASDCPVMNCMCCLCRWALVLWRLAGRQGQAGRRWYDALAGPFFWSQLVTSFGCGTGFWRYKLLSNTLNILVCRWKNTIFTAEYGLNPYSMLCDHKLAVHCYGMNNYWVFYPQGQHWPFDSMDIFVPDKCSQMPSCLSNSIQQHVVFQFSITRQ